jgi:hypothetical protein
VSALPGSGLPVAPPRDRRLTRADYERAAARLDVPVQSVFAVASVEAQGAGFLRDGRPKVLFEAHHFARYTRGAFSRSHPHLSSPTWNRSLYATGPTPEDRGQGEWKRLEAAMLLDRPAAVYAASWGLFQIMGFNGPACGVANVPYWLRLMHDSEGVHLDLFCELVSAWGLVDEMREQRWLPFSIAYNGPRAAENRYPEKMARAFALANTHLAAMPAGTAAV